MAVAVLAAAGTVSIRLIGMNGRVLAKAEKEMEILNLAEAYMEQAKGSSEMRDEARYRFDDYEIVVEQTWGETRLVPQFDSVYAKEHMVFSSLDLETGEDGEKELRIVLRTEGEMVEARAVRDHGEDILRTVSLAEENALYCFLPEMEEYNHVTIDSRDFRRGTPMPVFLIGEEAEVVLEPENTDSIEIFSDFGDHIPVEYCEKTGLRYITVTVWENGEAVCRLDSSSRKGERIGDGETS